MELDKSNFNSKFDFNEKIKNIRKFLINTTLNNIKQIQADLNNNLFLDLDETYKVKSYNYNFLGKIKKIELKFQKTTKMF